jgi:hypothetical protein
LELAAALLVFHDQVGTDDIGRHQIGGELDAGEVAVESLGQGAHQHGLAQAGHAFQQGVAARQQRDQRVAHQLVLPDDHPSDLLFNRRCRLAEFFGCNSLIAHKYSCHTF